MATAELLPERPPRLPMRRWSLAEYHLLGELGILTPEDRVELLEGWLVAKVTQNPPHANAVVKLQKLITRLLSDEWSLRTQHPITLSDPNEPEPDLVVAIGPDERYDERHPTRREIALVIEVADASLEQDRGIKYLRYARERLPEYWIVNVLDRQVEVYSRPRGGRSPGYGQRRDYGVLDSVPLVLAGREVGHIPLRNVLPALP